MRIALAYFAMMLAVVAALAAVGISILLDSLGILF